MQIAQIQPFNVAGKRKNVTRIVIHALAEYLDLEPWDLHAVDFLRSTQLNALVLAMHGKAETTHCLRVYLIIQVVT